MKSATGSNNRNKQIASPLFNTLSAVEACFIPTHLQQIYAEKEPSVSLSIELSDRQ